jgi:hypothetical protein
MARFTDAVTPLIVHVTLDSVPAGTVTMKAAGDEPGTNVTGCAPFHAAGVTTFAAPIGIVTGAASSDTYPNTIVTCDEASSLQQVTLGTCALAGIAVMSASARTILIASLRRRSP